jgi:4-hydroxymandelate oxidase
VNEAVRNWLFGGAADGLTLQANQAAWRELRLLPRVLRPLQAAHTRVLLSGRTLPHPIFVAPMAYQTLLHPLGETGCALAAASQGAGFVLSAQAAQPLEDVAREARGLSERGPLWFQLYLQGERGFDGALVRRAEAAGYEALVLTVDAPVQGPRARVALPPGVRAVNLDGAPPSAPGAGLCGGLLARAPTWDEVAWLRAQTRLPLWLKGVLHPDDARQAAALGVDGLIVSNHGGRVLDTAVSTAWALPRIADALQGALPLLVDGGIRRGTDVLKALALGASAVLVGRPVLQALGDGGPPAVAQWLRTLREEFEIALALCGCAEPSAVPRALVV